MHIFRPTPIYRPKIPDMSPWNPTTTMPDQQHRKKILSVLSSPFRALSRRPPSPNDADLVEAGVCGTLLGSTGTLSRPLATDSLAGTSRAPVISIGESQLVNDGPNQHLDRNIANPHNTTAMFSNIERLQIGVGNFTLNVNDHHDDPLKHVAFQNLPRSREAAFSASINLDNISRRRCTDGTRVDIIAQIMAWVNENDPAKAPPVYWLTGLAGLGKTTIAYTICERLDEAHIPFASFFCSLQLDSRSSKLLVPTLCRDLAELDTSYAASVLPTLETNSKVVDASLTIQINEMLAKPWQASIGRRKDRDLRTPIVVVDALDENDRGSEFLQELLRVIGANQFSGIKFLVTSRLDPQIDKMCKSFPPNAICKLHEVGAADVQDDIEKYLREALPELKDEPALRLLSQQAGGLFIYATTAVRFISPLHSPPSLSEMHSHLQVMLKLGTLTSYVPTHERLLVDELYERILGAAFRDDRVRAKRLRILHTVVCAESRIDIPVLADLTETEHDTVKRVVESLHAVLFVSSKDGCVYWYHASFPDFLFSQSRAMISLSLPGRHRPLEFDASCDSHVHHGVLTRRCLSVMHKSLHFNMCNLPSSYMIDSEIPGLDTCIDNKFSLTLRYASRQWAKHLVQAQPAENETDELLCGLKDFLDNKLFFWIEAMNLIGAKFECSSLLKDAKSWVKMGKKWPDLLEQLTDAINFSTLFAGSEASKSTPHLYISALSMWNQDSPTWKKWKKRFGFIPTVLLPGGTITIPLLTIHGTQWVDYPASSDEKQIGSAHKVWDEKTGKPKLLRIVGSVNSVAFSPDGDRIVCGSLCRSAWIWDAKSGELLRELQGHTENVASVAFSPDGNRIVSGSWDQSVRVWDADTGELLKELQGHTDSVTSVAFSPNGNTIVSGSDDTSVRVWDAQTGEQVRRLQGHTDRVTSASFSPDGNRIASGSGDKSLRVWDTKTGELLKELQGHTDSVTSVAFSTDGSRIVSSATSVRVWDAKTGEQLMELQGHTNVVTSVAFSPDGNCLVSGSWDHSVRVWNAQTGELLRELQGHTDDVASVAFSTDGNLIISGSQDTSMRVWDAKTGEQLRERQGHTSGVTSVAFSPDGNTIVSGSRDDSVRVWDAKRGEQLRELQGHTDTVGSIALSPDGNTIVSGSGDHSVRVWDAKTGKHVIELQGHTDEVTSVAVSTDGNRVISGSYDKSVRVWDAKTGEQLLKLEGHTERVTSVAFSPDGSRIVSGSEDKSLRVWGAKTGELLKELQHTDSVTSVTFSPDGDLIVSGSFLDSVQIWNANTGKQLRELQAHLRDTTIWVTSVAFSPNGKRIVFGSHDASVRLWDIKTGQLLRELKGHTSTVTSVAFSPDGNRIVSGSNDDSVRVWDNLNLDSWAIEEDGWIVCGAERLVWVPSSIRNVLLRPQNSLIISRNGSATISFDQCKLGTTWHQCYTST